MHRGFANLSLSDLFLWRHQKARVSKECPGLRVSKECPEFVRMWPWRSMTASPNSRHCLTDGHAHGAARRAARRAWRPASACVPPCSSAAACPCTACRAPPELEQLPQQCCRGVGNGTGMLAWAVPVGFRRPSAHVRTALCLLFPWGVRM